LIQNSIRNSTPYKYWSFAKSFWHWNKRRYAAPSPNSVKQSCLIRNGVPNATWVETGTYLGTTTLQLSKHALFVYSIEPSPTLFTNAKNHFSKFDNVEIINGLSENVFKTLLPKISGNVNFWLDGHYSEGITFEGPQSTPIIDELFLISQHLDNFDKTTICVDDVRCFDPSREFSAYPSVDFLVNWARENNLSWHIEHDIFFAKNHKIV